MCSWYAGNCEWARLSIKSLSERIELVCNSKTTTTTKKKAYRPYFINFNLNSDLTF